MQLRLEIAVLCRDVVHQGAAVGALLLSCVAASSAGAQPCADVTPPVLEITSPVRGEMIERGGTADDTVLVSGFAFDAESPLVSLVIDGQEQLSAQATDPVPFAVATSSPWGLSIVTASAEDACGNRVELAQSYLRSGAYFPAPTDPNPDATVGGALEMHANQALLDDGNRSDPDDLATLVDDAIGGIDWNTEIPNPLASQGLSNQGCSFPKTWFEVAYDAQHGTVSVTNARLESLNAVVGGIEANVALDSLHFPLSAHVTQQSCVLGVGPTTIGPLTVTGSVDSNSLSATALAAISLGHDETDAGRVHAVVTNPSFDLSSLKVSLDCGGFPTFVCNAVDSIVGLALALVNQSILQLFDNLIGNGLVSQLNSFHLGPTVDLPPPIAVTLDASSAFDHASAGASGVDLGIAAQLSPHARGASIPPDARGAIRRDGTAPSDVAEGYAFGVAVKDDLVNELLWATWYGGGFDLPDLRAEAQSLGFPVESLSVQAKLPPVVQPGASPDVAEIGLGDVLVHATVDFAKLLGSHQSHLVTVDFYVSALLDGRFGFAPPGRLRFDVDSTRVATQIVSASDAAKAEAMRSSLEKLFANVAQAVVDRVLGGLGVPAFDLGALAAAGLPPGTLLGLGNGVIDRPTADDTRLAADVAVYAAKDTLGVDASSCSGVALPPNPYADGVGYLFTAEEPLAVTALGEFTSVASLASDVVVALYDVTAGGSEQDLLAEETLSQAASGEAAMGALPVGGALGSTQDFFYYRVHLASPVLLHAGHQYGIVAWGSGGGGALDHPLGATVATAIHYDQGLLGSGAQSSPGNGMIEELDGSGELATLGPTIEFTPEPGPLASALVAIAAIGVARKLHERRRA